MTITNLTPAITSTSPLRLAYSPLAGRMVSVPQDVIQSGFVTIDPTSAKAVLDRMNTHNRNIADSVVERYARDMVAGRWLPAGDPIRFSHSGLLLDGQHRLAAIVRSGTSQSVMVVWNLEEQTQTVMDSGRKRAVSHQLTLRGVPNSSLIAATVRFILSVRATSTTVRTIAVGPWSESEVMGFFEQHEQLLLKATEVGRRVHASIHASPSVSSAMYFFFHQIDSQTCEDFFEKVITGTNLGAGDPVLLLRNAVVRNNGKQSRAQNNLLYVYYVKAWNMVRQGRTAKVIAYNPERESLPKPA